MSASFPTALSQRTMELILPSSLPTSPVSKISKSPMPNEEKATAYDLQASSQYAPTHMLTHNMKDKSLAYSAGWPCDANGKLLLKDAWKNKERVGILLENRKKPISVRKECVINLPDNELQPIGECIICYNQIRHFEKTRMVCKHILCYSCFFKMHEENERNLQKQLSSVQTVNIDPESTLTFADKCPLCKVLIGPTDMKPWWEDYIEIIISRALGCMYNRYAYYMRRPEPSVFQEDEFISECIKLCDKKLKGYRQETLSILEQMRLKVVADPYTYISEFGKVLLCFLFQHVMHQRWNKEAMNKAFCSFASSIGFENDNY